ncbi:MAG: tripartite tricarboxylate transporter substrate binding protein, partial [Planctomycetota bacterium]|nr:tripartite tricarboxylate transporter substrate binding protein [Planctomycetota bacterium]
MIRIFIFVLAGVLVICRCSFENGAERTENFPNQPIRIVVPYLPGGGTDTFARLIQKSLNQNNVYGVPVVIENRDGGSATIGSRFVKQTKPDGYRILCHHEGIIATQLAGVVPYGPEAFQPIAQTASIVLVMVVREDSPYRSLPDLLTAAQNQPNQIRMGANQGSPAYFLCQQMLREYPGADLNFVSASGSRRITYILGGKIEAGIFSLAEYLSFRKKDNGAAADNIVAIANFGETRDKAIPQVSTSMEQGLTTSAENAYYFWAPRETPVETISILADGLEKTLQDPEVLVSLERLALQPTFRKGRALESHLRQR